MGVYSTDGCCHKNIKLTLKTFRNGTEHLEKRCKDCALFLGYAPQNKPLQDDFMMPFGKYKGKTLDEIYRDDDEYVYWMCENLNSPLRDKIENWRLEKCKKIQGQQEDLR